MEQMDQHMDEMLPLIPEQMRDEARQVDEQMRPLMEQMMSGQDGMMGGSADHGDMMGGADGENEDEDPNG
jgi:hypothetical protein